MSPLTANNNSAVNDGGFRVQARPFISVCIPMYNNAATIERCLLSVMAQEGVEFEVLVVDDDSQDECRPLAKRMLRTQDRLVHNDLRLGLNGNHNRCLELASGTLVQFVHGDDELLPGALSALSHRLADSNVQLAFAPRRVVTEYPEWERKYGKPHRKFRTLHGLNSGPKLVKQMALAGVKDNWIGEPTSVMFRRRMALDIGGFRPDIYNFVDLDMWIRLMLRGQVGFVDQEQSVRYHSSTAESGFNWASEKDFLDRLRVLTSMLVDSGSPLSVRVLAAAWWLPTWLRLSVRTALHGRDRRVRMKTLMVAPVREIATARRLGRDSAVLSAKPSVSDGRDE